MKAYTGSDIRGLFFERTMSLRIVYGFLYRFSFFSKRTVRSLHGSFLYNDDAKSTFFFLRTFSEILSIHSIISHLQVSRFFGASLHSFDHRTSHSLFLQNTHCFYGRPGR